ncbi:MAG: nucleotidyltransferase domain-containing protein [Oscillospiraceae bacterium]|nr:nucleotidyltransferase domain-containing protein [Oscillospiraceae bacterium]
MDREQAIRIASIYADLVRGFINPSDIILFGSYANGNTDSNSDIDIAIVFDIFNGDYWQTIRKLHELTISVDTRIEPVLLDVNNDPSGFVKSILSEGLKVS